MKTTLIITGIIITVIGILVLLFRSKMKNIPLVTDHNNIITLTDKNFINQTKGKVVLVDFWASWCVPCRIMAPVLNDVASELSGNSYVGKVDIDQYQSLAQKYNVRNIPTLILFKDGIEVRRFVGIQSGEFLLQQVRKVN
jgi:thioredoxin 1